MKTKNRQPFQVVCFGSGRRTRTSDLRVMSPTSYRTALSRDVSFDAVPRHPIYRFCECKDKANFRICQIKSQLSRSRNPFRLPYSRLRTDRASGYSPYLRTLPPASGRTAGDRQTDGQSAVRRVVRLSGRRTGGFSESVWLRSRPDRTPPSSCRARAPSCTAGRP